MVISDQFPYVDVTFTVGTWTLVESVYIDTGHEGGLVIPSYLTHEIIAAPDWIPLRVANNQVTRVPSWLGSVGIGDRSFPVEIAAMGSRFLLGREVIDQLVVCFERGERVTVEF